ncbi:MAG: hypothetical protein M3P18_23355 [Actinomycetota bacterium]|nr:hypothetical protein [Actinomycetota bacterium]
MNTAKTGWAQPPARSRQDGVVVHLPNRRQSVEGETFDGATLRFSYSIARKLYRCPGCHSSVDIGSAHIVVQFRSADPRYHQHWHERCVEARLMRELKTRRVVPAS